MDMNSINVRNQLSAELSAASTEAHKRYKAAIKKAVEDGLHVHLLVEEEGIARIAWEWWKRLGFEKGVNPHVHVTLIGQHHRLPSDHETIYGNSDFVKLI